ncbi:phage major capsid protein [Streptomyces sp. SID3212]|nr:phage major capsid protein [Streptomyces sp. SID3212]
MPSDIAFPALKDVTGKMDELRQKVATVFAEAGTEMDFSKVKSISGNTFEKSATVRAWNDELNDLGKKHDDMQSVLKAAQRAQVSPDAREGEKGSQHEMKTQGRKSFGQHFVESQAYKAKNGHIGPEATLDVDLKSILTKDLMETTDGWAPETTRTGRVVDYVTRPIQVIDLIPQNVTNQSAVVYMEETTFTNPAAEVAEGGAYPEAELNLTEQNSPVRKISVFLPITDEQLEDVGQVRGYIDNRLPFMIRQRLDLQILSGDGIAPNLEGLLTKSGVQSIAKGLDATPDAIYKAMVAVRVTGQGMPNAAVFHPLDWQDIRLLRTADGIYIWGNPSDAGVSRIWGLQVTEAQALTQNTALVGDFANYCELAVRRGINTQVSNSHDDYFVKGKQAMRADMRAAFVVYRPAAFCKVTGV